MLLWVATAGRKRPLKPEVHLFFYDRYWRLSQHCERQGRDRRARRLLRKAMHHFELSGFDGPPFAAALAMPLPRPGLRGWAASQPGDSNDAA